MYVVVSLGCNSKPDDMKCSTHKSCIHNEMNSYKIHTLAKKDGYFRSG